MATREKTIRFAFPLLASAADASVTNFSQITIYIPETVVAFRSVQTLWFGLDAITATGGTWTEFRTGLRLGAAGYTTVTNTNDLVNSGENIAGPHTADFTSHFTANWTGTSMTCDLQAYCDQNTGTTLGLRDLSAEVTITYAYDDTASTHIKTVYIPLPTYNGASPTSKPGTAQATIPNLDTHCPEASKTYRDCYIVFRANEGAAGTVDFTASHEIDSAGATTSSSIERALASDRWIQHIHSKFSGGSVAFTTNATHALYWWASTAFLHHPQAYMVVTYEFDVASTTRVRQAILLPMEFASPAGDNAARWNRASRELWIQEPGTIDGVSVSALVHWEALAVVAGINMRIGTSGGFTTITDSATMMAGGSGCQVLATPTLARGRNTLSMDVYCTDTADLMWNLSVLWIVSYVSDKSSQGVGAHNQTRIYNLANFSTVAAAQITLSSSIAPVLSAASYFLTAVGVHALYLCSSTGNPAGLAVHAELTSGEGGFAWLPVYIDAAHTDAEVGVRQAWAQARSLFRRWTGDVDADRLDIETARRWKMSTSSLSFSHLDLYITWHTITFAVSGDASGSDAGTVTIDLHRSGNGERVLSTTRSGDGAYSFTWFDNTEALFVTMRDATGNAGRSSIDVATGTP